MSATIVIGPTPHTTIAARPARPVRPTTRSTEVVYRRRRAVVGTILAVIAAVGIVTTHDVLTGSGGEPAAAAGRSTLVRTTVTAQPGDSLWSIAQTHRGMVPVSRYVDKLVDLNGGASIRAGQAVMLP